MEKAQTEGSLQGYLAPTTRRTLANVKPVANWLDAALNTAYKDLYFAKKRKDAQLVARATARLHKLRVHLG